MIGKIISIKNSIIFVKLEINIYQTDNLIGKNITFANRYIGEITGVSTNMLETIIIGEIIDKKFIPGSVSIPSFNAECRLTTIEEIDIIYGVDHTINNIKIGKSFIYDNYDIYLNVNSFFSNHFSIFGNTGSGKSYFVTKLLQGIFYQYKTLPFNANIFLFDAYGEYQQAFNQINQVNNNLNYKVITTDLREKKYEKLQIPFWLLTVDDICLLLEVAETRQIPIIEKALKLVSYFSKQENEIIKQKNDIIARCLIDVIFSSSNVSEVRNRIITILTKFNTKDINLEIDLTKGGWTRKLRQCIYIETDNKFADIEIVINYLEQFINNDFELSFPDGSFAYTINDFYNSLEFALISEGIFSSSKIFEYANILKTRLNAIINSDYVNYFKYYEYTNKPGYIKKLLSTERGTKCQIVNFNINYIDDRFAKVIVKIFSKLLFDYIVKLNKRASMPFHIILEEAHRYVQDDIDRKILGYNIFDRITKEGRKYGILLGLISQRPLELSETAVSQCSNFAIFKMFHPGDVEFIASTVSGISESMIDKIRVLNPGNCILFGTAFKFPVLTKVDMPNPPPLSDSCNINNTWYIN